MKIAVQSKMDKTKNRIMLLLASVVAAALWGVYMHVGFSMILQYVAGSGVTILFMFGVLDLVEYLYQKIPRE